MKLTTLTIMFALLLTACGGHDSNNQTTQNGVVIDPSGNWAMKFTDSGNHETQIAALFNQVGVVVTANSITAAGNPSPFSCAPFSATFTNGLVSGDQGNIFTGNIVMQNFGTTAITSTLTPDGLAASGTYSGLPACTGTASTGTFQGQQVPSMSGSWTGTIQPCDFDTQTGGCPVKGTASPITFSLTQNDSTGIISGTYQVTNLAGFSNGTVNPAPGNSPPSDGFMISGHAFQAQLVDANGSTVVVAGGLNGPLEPPSSFGLGFDRTFKGTIFDRTNDLEYALNISH